MEELKRKNDKIYLEKKLFLQKKIDNALNKSESKIREKIKEYFERQKKFETIQKQKEKEKIDKLKEQNEEILRKSEKIKKVLKQYENNKKLKMIKYNTKIELLKKRQEEKNKEEMLILQEERRKKEQKEKRLLELKNKFEKTLNENRQRLIDKINANDIKIKNQKLEQEKIMNKKFNKLYMSQEDRKNLVIRKERVKDFQRTQKMEKIIARMKRMENLQKDRSLLEEERKKFEGEILYKKKIMREKLQNVIRSNKSLDSDEIINYVFDARNKSKTPLNREKNKI